MARSYGPHRPTNGVYEISFQHFSNVINGGLRSAKSFYHGINPVTQEELWPTPVASEEDIDDAVAAAQVAYAKWKKVAWKVRKEKLIDFTKQLVEHEEAFTELIIKETGKPVCLSDEKKSKFGEMLMRI